MAILLALAAPTAARAQDDPDRIARFAADIAIEADGSLLVAEEIDFLVTPGSWKHGIYRDFPTSYRDVWGFTGRVGFDVLEVTRDGAAEPVVLETAPFGVRVRIGSADVWLDEGLHRYRIVYRTTRQLLFHADADEIYWNVTGNDWAHPIDRAEATVHLPPGAQSLRWAAYTGYSGEAGGDFRRSANPDGSVTFTATRTLEPGEGLTVAIAFPKGFVAEPDAVQRLWHGLVDNLGLIAGVFGLLVTFAYFYRQWLQAGRDPEQGVVIPLFEAPGGLSPAATGYVWAAAQGSGMGRALAFAVALTSLAIKQRLTIREDRGNYTLKQGTATHRKQKLPPGEAAVMRSLFSDRGRSEIVIKPSYSAEIGGAVDTLYGVLRREHSDAYFRHNAGLWVLGALLALGSLAAACLLQTRSLEVLAFVAFGTLFGGAFSIPVVLFARAVLPPWRGLLQGRARRPAGTILFTFLTALFALPPLGIAYLAFEFFGIAMLALIVAQVAVVALFWHLLKAPTRLGRDMFDKIEGYRLYLSVAERDRLNLLTAEPEMTVELFEHHLPYAMALGVEDQWAGRFAASAGAASREAAEARSRTWYLSGTRRRDLAGMAKGLSGGLSRTLSRAATKPSSSSRGSSGGGSSGGGGGGGGGGSW